MLTHMIHQNTGPLLQVWLETETEKYDPESLRAVSGQVHRLT